MPVTEGDGNVLQDGEPSNQALPSNLTGKMEKVLSIEEAK